MPPLKKDFWQEFVEVFNTVEQYQCRYCQKKYKKNATRQQEHLNQCKIYQKYLLEQGITSTNTPPNVKRKVSTQTNLDGFTYKFNS